MRTIGEVLRLSTSFLEERKIERARRIAEELIAFTLEIKRLDLYLRFDRPVDENELSRLREWLKRAAHHEPVEYILGELEFYGCKIKVDRRVLIPRPETEILVEQIAKKISGSKILWDLCTGSGCIGISLKKANPALEVTLSDISEDALAVAARNAAENGIEVQIAKGDLLEPFAGRKADVIVCNPPYVEVSEYLHLQPSVRDFEPKHALVGGTEYYERLAQALPDYLQPGGQVFLEIGANQGEAVRKIFSTGPWSKKALSQDWSGRDRFFSLEMQ